MKKKGVDTKSREYDFRQHDPRNELADYTSEYADNPFHIPKEKIPPGMTYSWVLESIYNEHLPSRMMEFLRKGWTPVPRERHPELCLEHLLGRTVNISPFIHYGGQNLLECPTELCDKEKEKWNRRTINEVNSLVGAENFRIGENSIYTQFGGKHDKSFQVR
jgi:hypothetical protein